PIGRHRNAYKFSIRGNTRSHSRLFSLWVRTATRTAEECVISALDGFVGFEHVFGMLTVAASPTNRLGLHARPTCRTPFVSPPLVIADCAWSLHSPNSHMALSSVYGKMSTGPPNMFAHSARAPRVIQDLGLLRS